MASPSWHQRIYRAFLRMFPAEFRGDFGDAMSADFEDQRTGAGGRTRLARLWLRTGADLVRRAPAEHLEILRRDAGYAVRLLRRRPAFAATALLTLAIGIGLNTAVFSVVHAVLLRDLPLASSDRLVVLQQVSPAPVSTATPVSPANFIDWRAQAQSLDGLASISTPTLTLLDGPHPEVVASAWVSEDFFRIVPAPLAAGRHFTGADYESLLAAVSAADPRRPVTRPPPHVVMLSHSLWQRAFDGRPDIVGQTIRFANGPAMVAGVVDTQFVFPGLEQVEAWVPYLPEPDQRRARFLSAVGRLAPGVTAAGAQAEFDVIAEQLATAHPEANSGRGIRVTPLLASVTSGIRTRLWLLLAAAASVLLICCANVANLLLVHASGRRRELSTRAALGATRAYLVRQALSEGLVLAAAGGLLGVLLAYWTVPLLIALAPADIPRLDEIRVDGAVLGFAALLALGVGLVCGLAACLSIDIRKLHADVRTSGAAARHQGGRLRQALTVVQIAVALTLVVAAGLFVRTMRAVDDLELGYDPAHVVSVGLTPDMSRVRDFDFMTQVETALIERVRALPGVTAAGIGSRPLSGTPSTTLSLPADPAAEVRMSIDVVGPGYLEALGGRLLAGRFIDERDTPSAERVALVNQAAATELWPDQQALGQAVIVGSDEIRIVGIVADVRRRELEQPPGAALYFPSAQTTMFRMNNMLIRTTGDPRALVPAVRSAMREIDPRLPLTRIQTLQARLDEVTAPRRFILRLVGLFSLVALGLAMIGIYGVAAEWVSQRVPEIGIRMALGATPAVIMRMVLGQAGWMSLAGLTLGLAAALGLSRTISGFLFGVTSTDPAAYATAAGAMAAASLVACLVPARRAASIDPVRALRQN